MPQVIRIHCAGPADRCTDDCRQGRGCEGSRRLTRELLLRGAARRPGIWLLSLAACWALVFGAS